MGFGSKQIIEVPGIFKKINLRYKMKKIIFLIMVFVMSCFIIISKSFASNTVVLVFIIDGLQTDAAKTEHTGNG